MTELSRYRGRHSPAATPIYSKSTVRFITPDHSSNGVVWRLTVIVTCLIQNCACGFS